jgi:hypothetical protein
VRVDLGQNIDFDTTLDKISQALALCNPELANEAGMIADLRLLKNYHLVYFSQCRYLDDEERKKIFLHVVTKLVDTTRKIKVIFEDSGELSLPNDNPQGKF